MPRVEKQPAGSDGWMRSGVGDSMYHHCRDEKQNEVCDGAVSFGWHIYRDVVGRCILGVVSWTDVLMWALLISVPFLEGGR